MISKRLTVLAGIAASLVWVSTANAVTVSIGLQAAGVNSGNITDEGSAADHLSFDGSYGAFNINTVAGTAADGTFATNSQNHASSAGTLTVYVTASDISDPIGTFNVLSVFSQNSLPAGFTVTEESFFDQNNEKFSTTTPLGSHSFNGPVTVPVNASSLDLVTVLTGLYSVTAKYTIVATGSGTADSAIHISAETPLPGTLPLIAGGLGALWMVGRKRKARKAPMAA
jgi:hypothetical protein